MKPIAIDSETYAIFLEVPHAQVVALQARFEIYEGLATVRTVDKGFSLVSVVTTASLLPECVAALQAAKSEIQWRELEDESRFEEFLAPLREA